MVMGELIKILALFLPMNNFFVTHFIKSDVGNDFSLHPGCFVVEGPKNLDTVTNRVTWYPGIINLIDFCSPSRPRSCDA